MRIANDSIEIRSRFIRVVGEHRTAAEVLRTASLREDFPIRTSLTEVKPLHDYAQIDLALAAAPSDAKAVTIPNRGLSYAGFSPEQRWWFLEWLDNPTAPAPPAFQQLYLAHMEVALFEEELAAGALESLLALNGTPAWKGHLGICRSILLGLWAIQGADILGRWIASGNIHPDLLGCASGHLALLHEDSSPGIVGSMLVHWGLVNGTPNPDILALRLGSLEEALGAAPLKFALSQLGVDAQKPQPWRCHHRDLRIALPQPDLRQALEPILRELFDDDDLKSLGSPPTAKVSIEEGQGSAEDGPWSLVLEFGESRSEYFPYALQLAKQRPHFSQLMDEDRKLVYRVVFQKREMRHFWRLWEYVTNWSGTTVYVNGQRVEKYNIWPYSPQLR